MTNARGRLAPPLVMALTGARRLAAGLVAGLAASSYFAYTTAGFDFERATPSGAFEVVYYRLRWDAGATWAGRAVQPVPRPDHPPDWFDPGGTLLDAPSRPERRSRWNRWGFWWIARAADDPYVPLRYPGATTSRWAAVPSWLVLAAPAGMMLARGARRRRRQPGGLGAG